MLLAMALMNVIKALLYVMDWKKRSIWKTVLVICIFVKSEMISIAFALSTSVFSSFLG